MRTWPRDSIACASLVLAAACSSSEHVVGEQCPSPYSGNATVRGPNADKAGFFGTSCAPCKADDAIKLDARGCPIFYTFETCGGPVCLNGYEIVIPAESDGGAENDSGAEDSGVEEDSGAH
jgi:hypothetical protein